MKFNYVRPSTEDELTKHLKNGGILFAGGTDIFVKLRAGIINPQLLIDSKNIPISPIEFEGEKLKIYMNNTYAELLENNEVKEKYPLLYKVALSIGSTQIRNKGTMIGNIANASPAGDFLLSSYLYDANVIIKPSNRIVPIQQFIKGPGKTDLSDGEYIYSLEFPYLENYKFYYEKVGRRNEMIIAIASLGILLKCNDNNLIEDIRIAYGSVGPTVVRFKDYEKEFIGKEFREELFEKMAESYKDRIRPIDDVRGSADYRKKVVKNLLLKAYHNLAGDYKW